MFAIEPAILLRAALIFMRIAGILFALPVFGDDVTPVRVRILLALALAACLYPLVPAHWQPALGQDVFGIALMVVRELLIGLSIGFVAKIAFEGMVMAAGIVGFQMGFGTASLLMPGSDSQSDGFSATHRMLAMLIFLSLNLHHVFLKAIIDTFPLIAPGGAIPRSPLAASFVSLTAGVFVTALQLAAPILIALLFTMSALGLIARTVPQLNVFTVSFQASFFIGLLVYVATMPFFPPWMRDHFAAGHNSLVVAMRSLTP